MTLNRNLIAAHRRHETAAAEGKKNQTTVDNDQRLSSFQWCYNTGNEGSGSTALICIEDCASKERKERKN